MAGPLDPLLDGTIEDAAMALRAGAVTALELTDACLGRIERAQPELNAFITVTAEAARERARALDGERLSGATPLRGIPMALKDLFDLEGTVTTAGSSLHGDQVAREDSAVAARLREAGTVPLGKTNLHEWAFGVTTDNPHFGPTRNPWDRERIPGGSSGGSAAAIAAGLCFGSVGSDTGGSIRIPASLCGIVGLKPTYGRISLRGAVPLAWSLDHPGPMARAVRDIALLLGALAGYDARDPVSVDVPVDDPLAAIESGVRGARLGLVEGALVEGADPQVAAAVALAARTLEGEGARVEAVDLPRVAELREAQAVIIGTEAAAVHRERLAAHRDAYGADVAARIERGLACDGVAYARARRTRDELRRSYAEVASGFDALLLPATPTTAPLRAGQDALAAAARLTAYTSAFNLTGLPALALPCGADVRGLPIGLQLAARPWAEATLLRVARAYERATPWHERRPR